LHLVEVDEHHAALGGRAPAELDEQLSEGAVRRRRGAGLEGDARAEQGQRSDASEQVAEALVAAGG
jgi:hypothetical protein